MNTTITKEDGFVRVALQGELDTQACARFQEDIAGLMTAPPAEVELDLSELEYIASMGIRIFISLLKAVVAAGGSLKATHPSPAIREVFDMTGLSSSFFKD
ncbi:MAG: STAS domain-containing protein [Bacteroidales bacterium]|nr:STAS domain-containing protein [Bacteroidales bacterium]